MSERPPVDPQQAFSVAARIIDSIQQDGGVDAVIMDIKAHHGIDVDPEVVRDIMACGGVCILMVLGHGIKAGLLRMEGPRDVVMGSSSSGALKSETQEDNSVTLDAERAASEAIARIRKMH